jgi:NitT/TauT family transport system permease protein
MTIDPARQLAVCMNVPLLPRSSPSSWAIIAIWYAAAVFSTLAVRSATRRERAGTTISFSEILPKHHGQERPVLPAPHQVAVEFWDTTVGKKITSKRSLVYHSWITLSSTLLGFAMGTVLGVALAVGIVHYQTLDAR